MEQKCTETSRRMTPRERLLAPFHGVRPDRPAWVADLTYWYGARETTGTLPAEYKGRDGFRKLHDDLGVGYYYYYGASEYKTSTPGVVFVEHESDGKKVRTWHTRKGSISERWELVPQSFCWAHVDYAVKTVADLNVLQEIFASSRHEPDLNAIPAAVEYLGDRGVPISAVPRSPLPGLLTDWCGVMNTIYLLADEPQAVEDTLAIIDRANDKAFECIVGGSSELLHFCDNLDSGNSGSYFATYMAEYYRRRLAQVHAAGKAAAVHLDGAARGLLPKLAACGFDAIEAVTPGPVGDIEIEDLRSVTANPKTIIWGGIPGAMFATPWTAADIRSHTRRLLDALWPAGRLVVGSADQVPPDGNIDFCRIIAETIEEYGG